MNSLITCIHCRFILILLVITDFSWVFHFILFIIEERNIQVRNDIGLLIFAVYHFSIRYIGLRGEILDEKRDWLFKTKMPSLAYRVMSGDLGNLYNTICSIRHIMSIPYVDTLQA